MKRFFKKCMDIIGRQQLYNRLSIKGSHFETRTTIYFNLVVAPSVESICISLSDVTKKTIERYSLTRAEDLKLYYNRETIT